MTIAVVVVSAMVLAPSAVAEEPPGLSGEICETEYAAGKVPAGTRFCLSLPNFETSATLTDRKLNQSIELKEGTFNGFIAFSSFSPAVGTIHGVTAVKPFEATVKLFGVPTKVGLTFEQVGEASGPFDELAQDNCPAATGGGECFHEGISTQANLGFTSITLFGLKIPLSCKTATPISLPLEEDGTLTELLGSERGSHFTGTTTFPIIKCEGALGSLQSVVLSALFSGPTNSYSITIRA